MLNCEAVLELLTRHLDGPSECTQMVRPGPWGGCVRGQGSRPPWLVASSVGVCPGQEGE